MRVILRALASLMLLSLGALIAPPAHANGRFPAAGQIVIHPSDPSRITARATFGLVTSSDGGAHFAWVCEESIGYSGIEDPMIAVTASGAILAGLFEGLSRSTDGGCSFALAPELVGRYVVDLALDRSDPHRALALVAPAMMGGPMEVWATADDGATWAPEGSPLPDGLTGLTVDAAPTDPDRIYVSGYRGAPDFAGVIARSFDRGMSYEAFVIPGADTNNLPYIAAIDPMDPARVYVRIDGPSKDHVALSTDSGGSWLEAFGVIGSLTGFALSPDGSTIAVGGEGAGLSTAPRDTLEFTKRSIVAPLCLTWTNEGLYACADEINDGFLLGLSKNGGAAFDVLVHRDGLCGPLACADGTSTASACPAVWETTRQKLGGATCEEQDGGAPDAGATKPPAEERAGCACEAGPGSSQNEGLYALFAIALSARWARSRRATRRGPRTCCGA